MNHILAVFIILFSSALAHAQEFRTIQPVPSQAEEKRAAAELTRQGLRPVRQTVPIPREVVEKVLQQTAESWNSPDMAKTLSNSFRDKERLGDSLARFAPQDAKMRLVSVGSYRILAQAIKPDNSGDLLISKVSVIARTQVEYTNTAGAFQRKPGEQEYLLTIKLKVDRL